MSLLFLLWSISARAETAEPVSLVRYFATTVCYAKENCVGPAVKNLEASQVTMQLEAFRKGNSSGWHAWDRNSLTESGVTLKSEIHVVKHAEPREFRYSIYAMLRSGKREGVVKTIYLKKMEDLRRIVLKDKPVKTGKGTVQAELVLDPVWVE